MGSADKTKEQLMSELQIFKTMAENSRDWLYWLNPDRNLVYIAPFCEVICGYSPDDFHSNPKLLTEIVHPQDRQEYQNHSDAVFKSKKTAAQIEFRIIAKNGQTRWISHECRPVHNEQNIFIGIHVCNRDISEQKKNEEELQAHHEKTELLQQTIEELNRAQSHDEIFKIAVSGIIKILSADRSAILLFEDDGQTHFKAWRNLSAAYRKIVDGHSPWQAHETDAKPICFPDVSKSNLEKKLKQTIISEGIGALAFVPLIAPDRLLGKFMVYFNSPHLFPSLELQLAQVIAQNLSTIILRLQALENSQRMELKYRSIFNSAAEGIYQSTPEGKFITINPAMVKIFGYDNTEAMLQIKNTAALYWDAQERKRLAALVETDGSLKNVEVKMKRADGSSIWVLMNDRAVKDAAGKTLYYEGALLDISEQKKAKDALIESEETFRNFVEASADLVVRINKRGFIEYVSPRVKELYGYEADELIGKHLKKTTPLKDIPKTLKALNSAIKGNELRNFQINQFAKSGELIPMEINAVPIVKGGKIVGLLGILRDITQRKQAEQNLRESEEKYRRVINTVKEIIFQTDTQGLWTFLNPAWEEITGFSVSESIGRLFLNFVHPDDREKNTAEFRPLIERKKDYCRHQVRYLTKSGGYCWIEVHATLIYDEHGNPTGTTGTLSDITELKIAESETLQRESVLYAIAYTAEELLKSSDWQISINQVLEKLGKSVNVSRVYIFGNSTSADGTLLTSQRFEWVAEGIAAQIDMPELQNIPLIEAGYSRWIELLQKGQPVYGVMSDFPESERPLLEAQDIRSLAVFPIFSGDSWWGFIGFDDCLESRKWGGAEIESLKSVAGSIGAAIARKWSEDALHKQLRYAQALNYISDIIIREEKQQVILENLVQVAGEALQSDRCLVYDLDMEKQELIGLCEWLNPQGQDIIPTKATYPVAMFSGGANYLYNKKDWLESHYDKINPNLIADGSGKILHEQMGIKSGLWYPLAFDERGCFLLVFNHVQARRIWRQAEYDFTEALAGLVEIALMKMRFLEQEKKASAQINRLAAVVDQASEAIVVTDLEGRMEYVNPAFEKMTGYSTTEALGQTTNILKSGYQDEQFYNELWTTMRSGQVWSGRFIDYRKDGNTYNEEAVIFPLKDAVGKIINYCKISRDVSREEELEAQLRQSQKMEAVGSLAGGVAHDFNNLLTVINGYSELALNKIGQEHPLFNNLTHILNAAQKAERLTSQLLAFSRKQIYQVQIVDINDLISGLDKILGRLIGEDINMEMLLDKSLPLVKADPSQIEQIFINLVVNARDAVNAVDRVDFKKNITIESGQADLSKEYVTEHHGSQEGKHVFFAVSDNGVGMDNNLRERIFEPFFTTKEKHKGTGLGLSMVYGIVKQNKGSIYVYSEPGQGTTFKIYWPVSEEVTVPEIKNKIEDVPLTGNESILFVEDDEYVRNFTYEALSSLGYKVYAASNGKTALELIKAEGLKIELLITDMIMPEMNGKELAQRIVTVFPQIKIIFASGYTDNHIVHEGLLDTNTNFIQKPFTIQALAKIIRQILESR